MSTFFVRILLPKKIENREALSDLVARVASRFSFQGLEDWQVSLDKSTKVLGVETEFHDLRLQGKQSQEMKVYFAKSPHAKAFSRLLSAVLPELKISSPRELKKTDWMKEWRKYFRTQKISQGRKKIYIVPAWKKSPKGLAVRIYPGQAFGTGTHPTTRLCLQLMLKEEEKLGEKILDFGAGTGILAIAAAKMKKNAKIVAVESDVVGMEQCEKNIRINGLKIPVQNKIRGSGYDFILANVLAPVLLAKRKDFARRLKRGGHLVLSGILRKESLKFQKEFQGAGLGLQRQLAEGDWVALLYCKR